MIEKLTDQQIIEVLEDNVWGHLGCNDGLNTYVYPLNYFYDGKYITCHSQEGFKVQVMRKNNRVCFQVDEMENHTNWKSVMVLGKYQEVHDEQEYNYAMKAFSDRRLFLKKSESTLLPRINKQGANIQVKNGNRPVIYRILIDEKKGRYEYE